MEPTHIFAGSPLDRADRERRDPAWIEEQLRRPDTRFLPFRGTDVLLMESSPVALGWVGPEALEHLGENAAPVLLGVRDGIAHFGVDVSGLEDPVAALGLGRRARFEDGRAAATRVSTAESGTLAHAKALVDWNARHRFCAQCGAATSALRGGGERACDACGAHHFPRTDPVVIMLVSHGDTCLLGSSRARSRASAMYSALAGFVEQGESIEEAVRREVREEAGVAVGRIRYHSSQPWPFPSSLMIGCLAEADTADITIDEHEMRDVRWFPRAEVQEALRFSGHRRDDGGLMIPGPIAIAHHLIRAWVEGAAPRQ